MNETTPFRGQAIIKINVVDLPKHAGRPVYIKCVEM